VVWWNWCWTVSLCFHLPDCDLWEPSDRT
jgi:hypothetical protein